MNLILFMLLAWYCYENGEFYEDVILERIRHQNEDKTTLRVERRYFNQTFFLKTYFDSKIFEFEYTNEELARARFEMKCL